MGTAPALCKYGCGKIIYWDNAISVSRIKFRETDGDKLLHDYRRCAELLKEQGKDVKVLKQK